MLTTEYPSTSDTQVTLEQPAELSQHLRRPGPVPPEFRKHIYGLFLPLGFFTGFGVFELMVLARFKGVIHPWSSCLLGWLGSIALHIVLAELLLRGKPGGKRTLSVVERGLKLYPRKHPLVHWKWVRGISVAPVPGEAGVQLLTIDHGPVGRPFRQHSWKMIIPTRREAEEFIRRLKEQIASRQLIDRGVKLHDRPQPDLPLHPIPNMVLMLLGLLLFLHGFPLVCVGLSNPDATQTNINRLEQRLQQQHPDEVKKTPLTPNQLRLVRAYESVHQYFLALGWRGLFVGAGAILLFLAALCLGTMYWGERRNERRWMQTNSIGEGVHFQEANALQLVSNN